MYVQYKNTVLLLLDAFLPYNFPFGNKKNNLEAITFPQFIVFLLVLPSMMWPNSDFSCIIFSSTSNLVKHEGVKLPYGYSRDKNKKYC